jgi:Spy/CpxP family protein refolding chaperone
MKLSPLFLSLFVAGMLFAQTAPASHARRGDMMLQRLTASLNLTTDQQAQAKTIFKDSRAQAQALMPQLKQEHQAMQAAVKSDNEAQIDQILQGNSQLNAQVRAIHAKARAKFYALLTPAQKATYDQNAKARFSRMHTRARSHAAQNVGE